MIRNVYLVCTKTCVDYAIRTGNLEIISLILSADYNGTLLDRWKPAEFKSILSMKYDNGRTILDFLLEGRNLFAISTLLNVDKDGSLIRLTAEKTLQKILNLVDPAVGSILHIAAVLGHKITLKNILVMEYGQNSLYKKSPNGLSILENVTTTQHNFTIICHLLEADQKGTLLFVMKIKKIV